MKTINKKNWDAIISGANLLATGGGGTIMGASKILKKIKKPIKLVALSELKSNDLVCTVFGVGGKQNCDPVVASKAALKLFQTVLNDKISTIISVETGAMAIANAMFIASELEIPLLDSDIVGLRSSPEVFLETITLANLSRAPLAVCDDKGNQAVLWKSESLEKLEQFLRNFAISVGGDAIVAGYPLTANSLKNVVCEESVSISQTFGEMLQKLKNKEISFKEFCGKMDWKLIGTGEIQKVEKDASKGFSEGKYKIGNFTVVFKNENIVVLDNNDVSLTSPDSISLLDLETFEGVNNFEENKNKKVAILGKKAIPIWRTPKGKKLFSPKNLGLNYEQKLLHI